MPAAVDDFAGYTSGLDSVPQHAVAVVPDDNNDLVSATRYLEIGVGGDVKVTTVGGETVVFSAVPAATVLPIRATRVWATGTTATNLVALR